MKPRLEIGLTGFAMLLLTACEGTPRPVAGYVPPAAGTVAPEMLVSDASNGPIGAGDVLSVLVFREPDLSLTNVQVDSSGTIQLPLIGTTQAAGSTAAELSARIRTGLKRYVVDPRVTVNVAAYNSRPVTIEGEVNQPGIVPYQNGMTLLSAMAVARGTTLVARSEEVAVIRTTATGRYIGVFDLGAIRAGRMPDIALQPKDYVVVGRSARRQLFRDVIQIVPVLGLFTRF